MTTAELTAVLEAARRLLGLSSAELEKGAANPKQLAVLGDFLSDSQ